MDINALSNVRESTNDGHGRLTVPRGATPFPIGFTIRTSRGWGLSHFGRTLARHRIHHPREADGVLPGLNQPAARSVERLILKSLTRSMIA
jgi:hypothetical protein